MVTNIALAAIFAAPPAAASVRFVFGQDVTDTTVDTPLDAAFTANPLSVDDTATAGTTASVVAVVAEPATEAAPLAMPPQSAPTPMELAETKAVPPTNVAVAATVNVNAQQSSVATRKVTPPTTALALAAPSTVQPKVAQAPAPVANLARLRATTAQGSATRPLAAIPSASTAGRMTVASISPVSARVSGVWSDSYSLDLRTLGVGWACTTLVWSAVEPSSGVFNWGGLDQSLADLSAGGTRQVLVQVRGNPTWAATSACKVSTDAERTQLANFMTSLVTRYRSTIPDGVLAGSTTNVKFWQLYNEADNTSEPFDQINSLGGCFGSHDAWYNATQAGRDSYAAMLEAVGPAIHAADASAKVVMAGLASGNYAQGQGAAVCAGDNNPKCLFDPGFLRGVVSDLKAHNTFDRLDEIAVHFYSSQSGLFAINGTTDLISRLEYLKSDMRLAGLSDAQLKPVIVDEGSYTDSVGTSTSNPSDPFNLKQRNYVVKALARSVYEGVEAYFWFALQDMNGGLGGDNAYGLRAIDGTSKPSYAAMQRFASLLDQRSRFVGKVTLTGTLEGYEWVLADGRHARVVWNEDSNGTIAYLPSDGTIVEASDPTGAAVNVADNTAQVGQAPMYLILASAQLCRPGNVQVTAVPNGDGRLRVTLGAGSSALPALSLQFAAGDNALIDLPTQPGRVGPFTNQLPSGSFSYTFYVRRAVAGSVATQSFSVIDGCGLWQTFVGGGPSAF